MRSHIPNRLLRTFTFRNFSLTVIITLLGAAVEARSAVNTQSRGKVLQDSSKSKEPAALRTPMTLQESATAQVAYMVNCRACHGIDRMGASAPSLYKLNNRVTFKEFITVVDAGSSQMPGFPRLDDKTRIALYKYLSEIPVQADQQQGSDQRKQ